MSKGLTRRTEMKRGGPIGRKSAIKPGNSPALAPSGKKGRRNRGPDEAWAASVKDRAEGYCQNCGGPGHHAHHLYEKGSARFAHLRHDLRNGCFLCANCHLNGPNAAHNNLPAFRRRMARLLPSFTPLFEAMENEAADVPHGEGG